MGIMCSQLLPVYILLETARNCIAKIFSIAISKCYVRIAKIDTFAPIMYHLCNIRQARKDKKLSLRTVSASINASRQRLSRYENGKGELNIDQLQDYCNALGLTVVVVDAGELRILQAFEAEKVNYRVKTGKNRAECGE